MYKEELKNLLRELRSEADLARIEEKARLFLQDIDPEALAIVEQELIEEGISPDEIRRLCEIHLKAIAIKSEEHRISESHPISILEAEHEIILDNLKTLEETVKRIESSVSPEQLGEELERIRPVATLLLEAEKHHQREEEALFPRLEERGITGPPTVMRMEHEDLRASKKELKKLLDEYDASRRDYLVERISVLGSSIVSTLRDHIYKENNILYPLALKAISGEEWGRIKRDFDTIGYCCFTPGVEAHHHEENRSIG